MGEADGIGSTIEYYDAIAGKSFDEWFDNDALLPSLSRFVSLLGPSPELLDLGCGTGGESKRLIGLGARVTGVDLSAASIALARAHVPGGRFLLMDILELDFPEASFDGIVEAGVLFHFDSGRQESILASLSRLLRAGGKFLSYYPEGNYEGIDSFLVGGREYGRYARRLPIGSWITAVEAAGFLLLERPPFSVGNFRCCIFAAA
jgi:SAM-dependent methyltransferase